MHILDKSADPKALHHIAKEHEGLKKTDRASTVRRIDLRGGTLEMVRGYNLRLGYLIS